MERSRTQEKTVSLGNSLLLGLPLLFLPLIFGGARPWLWSATAGTFIFGLVFPLFLNDRPSLKPSFDKPLFILGFLILYPFIQILPLPVSWIALLSPHKLTWLSDASGASGLYSRSEAISYGTVTTLFAGFWWLFLALFALLFGWAIRDERSLDLFFGFLFVLALFESLYGLLQVLVPNLGVLWYQDPDGSSAGIARGTFINRNHYAAFLGMIWPLLLSYVLSVKSSLAAECPAYPNGRTNSKSGAKQALLIFIVAMVLLGLIFSMSRGGIIGALIALTVFIAFGRGAQRKIMGLSLIGCWIIVFSYGALIGFDGIVKRFEKLSDDAPSRIEIWEDSWHIIKDHPLTGIGLGNNPLVFDIYQSNLPDTLHCSHAHNDYLELVTELGLPAALAIILLTWGYWWKTAWRLWSCKGGTGHGNERRSLMRLGAFAGSAAFLAHSWVEFNWQIPANQLYFIVLLVFMGSGPSPRSSKSKS